MKSNTVGLGGIELEATVEAGPSGKPNCIPNLADRRYRSYPGMCDTCACEPCIFGRKPYRGRRNSSPVLLQVDQSGGAVLRCEDCGGALDPRVDHSVRAHAGCRFRCHGCDELFKGYGKALYCSQACRSKAVAKQRRLRRGTAGIGLW